MKERRLFSRHSIGTRIAALFMLLILVITAVMTYVSISVLTNELLDNATEYTEQLIRRVNAELDMYVEYMKDISDFIVDNGAVAAYLRAANEHRLTDAACRDAQEQLAAAQKIRSEITAIALIPESGGALFGSVAHIHDINCTDSGGNKISRFRNATPAYNNHFRQFPVVHAITDPLN